MKKYLFVMVLLVAGCASKAPVGNRGSKYANVLDTDNRITADVNTTTGDVMYYQSPEKAFEALFHAYVSYKNQVDAAMAQSQPKPEVKKEEVKKAPEKKIEKK